MSLSETIERSRRHVYQGRMVPDKMDKIITVVVDTCKNYPVYEEHIKCLRKYYAHGVNNNTKVGDTVHIMEARPLSCQKHYRLIKIVRRRV